MIILLIQSTIWAAQNSKKELDKYSAAYLTKMIQLGLSRFQVYTSKIVSFTIQVAMWAQKWVSFFWLDFLIINSADRWQS